MRFPFPLRISLALVLFLALAGVSGAQCRCGPGCDCGPACDCNVLKNFQPTAAEGQAARLKIHAPPGSTVELNGAKMATTGPCHHFETPPLPAGEYHYTVTVRSGDWTFTTKACVRAGETTTCCCPGCEPAAPTFETGYLLGGACAGGSCGAGGCAGGQCGAPASRGFLRRR